MNYLLDNTNGLVVKKNGVIHLTFTSYESMNDWIMVNVCLLADTEVDKFYGWISHADGG